jgi:hypothetical protein
VDGFVQRVQQSDGSGRSGDRHPPHANAREARADLEEQHEPRLAAAFLVLHPMLPAIPILPGDPLEVLDLEADQRHDPKEDSGIRHEVGFLPDHGRRSNRPFG